MRTGMFITEDYGKNRFKISIGVGKLFKADTEKEILLAVNHYFNSAHHPNENIRCPLCRTERKD